MFLAMPISKKEAGVANGKHHDQAMFYEAVGGMNALGICVTYPRL